jgi:hypothetical protein
MSGHKMKWSRDGETYNYDSLDELLDDHDDIEAGYVVSFGVMVDQQVGAWNILVEGMALGAAAARVHELADKWACDDTDADNYANRLGIGLDHDGNQWCATGPYFENLQESPAGFGDTKLDAMAGLAKDMQIRAGKMWRTTFKDMLTATEGAAHG